MILKDRLDLLLDTQVSISVFEQGIEEVPLELLAGGRVRLPHGLSATLALGGGLTRGVGTPAFRLIAGVSYQYLPQVKRAQATVRDSDGDGIPDDRDRCPVEPEDKDGFEDDDGCPDPDNDKDGIPDKIDQCPNAAEDIDGFEDHDGCPDPDNDRDGVLDANDKCPAEQEDRDGYKDDDGCPDLDNDSDGIVDEKDRCPNHPEDLDGFEDDDGCPDLDNDGDGIPDLKDKCPNEPETFNGVADQDGCPDKGRGPIQISRDRITVPAVHFATQREQILSRSLPTLRKVAQILIANPWIKLLRIEGHTDDRGNRDFNLELSERRAQNIRFMLFQYGVSIKRMTAQGFGKTKPITTNKTRAGRAKNRRVDFVIVEPRLKR
jgi:outer membrane protein OmpA-like peptidoglycan-associated protein